MQTLGKCRAGVYRLDAINGRHVRQLMRSLAAAATPIEPDTPTPMETVC
jgi:hypothetical protein